MSYVEYVTLPYKQLANTSIYLDVYPPSAASLLPLSSSLVQPLIPAVIYFHGGGLTVGNRKSWFPAWLYKRVISAGHAFISADYQLLPPATGHDIVQDLRDLLPFVVNADISVPPQNQNEDMTPLHFKIDPEAIAVAGSSAGGLCAYLAAMHCTSPRPKALLSMYGMGGNFLTPHYLNPKTVPFFRGREILDPNDPSFSEYLHPLSESLEPMTDSPLVYHPNTYRIPGYPANPRMLLARLFLQLGVFLDYYTGEHEPGLSSVLRECITGSGTVTHSSILDVTPLKIPERHKGLFPQLGVSQEWPPTMLCHGLKDTAVPVAESYHMRDLLRHVGVVVEMIEFEGAEHSFDYEPGAEVEHKEEFNAVGEFLNRWLTSGRKYGPDLLSLE